MLLGFTNKQGINYFFLFHTFKLCLIPIAVHAKHFNLFNKTGYKMLFELQFSFLTLYQITNLDKMLQSARS